MIATSLRGLLLLFVFVIKRSVWEQLSKFLQEVRLVVRRSDEGVNPEVSQGVTNEAVV